VEKTGGDDIDGGETDGAANEKSVEVAEEEEEQVEEGSFR